MIPQDCCQDSGAQEMNMYDPVISFSTDGVLQSGYVWTLQKTMLTFLFTYFKFHGYEDELIVSMTRWNTIKFWLACRHMSKLFQRGQDILTQALRRSNVRAGVRKPADRPPGRCPRRPPQGYPARPTVGRYRECSDRPPQQAAQL